MKNAKSRSLLSSSLVVGVGTMMSRVLGLVRDIVFAAFFGNGGITEAFFIAFKIPNFLRRLFAEGAFAQAFVPVLVEYKQKGDFSLVQLLVAKTVAALGSTLLVITTIVVVAAPWLSIVIAPGYFDEPEKLEMVGRLLQITFPYLLLISLVAFSGSILNSYNQFAVPALTPIWLNISLIFAAVYLSEFFVIKQYALAWGVMIAGVAQLLF